MNGKSTPYVLHSNMMGVGQANPAGAQIALGNANAQLNSANNYLATGDAASADADAISAYAQAASFANQSVGSSLTALSDLGADTSTVSYYQQQVGLYLSFPPGTMRDAAQAGATTAIAFASAATGIVGTAMGSTPSTPSNPNPSSAPTAADLTAAAQAVASTYNCADISNSSSTFYSAVHNFKNVWNSLASPSGQLAHNGLYDANCSSAVSQALGSAGPAACGAIVPVNPGPIVVNPPPGVIPPNCGPGTVLDPTHTKCVPNNVTAVVPATAATTNWLPWVLGGVGLLAGVGLILYANSKKSADVEAPALPMTPVMAHELMLTENPRRRARKSRRSRRRY